MASYGIFVGDLSATTDENDLESLFAQFGTIKEIRLKRDKKTGKSLLYGFVDFHSPKSAADAIRTLDGVIFKGRGLRIKWATNKSTRRHHTEPPRVSSASVHVSFRSIADESILTEEWLREIFEVYGPVVDITIRTNNSNQKYAFVRFTDSEDGITAALRSVRELADVTIEGIKIQCQFSHDLEHRIVAAAQSTEPFSATEEIAPTLPATVTGEIYPPILPPNPLFYTPSPYNSPPINEQMFTPMETNFQIPHVESFSPGLRVSPPSPLIQQGMFPHSQPYPPQQYQQQHQQHSQRRQQPQRQQQQRQQRRPSSKADETEQEKLQK